MDWGDVGTKAMLTENNAGITPPHYPRLFVAANQNLFFGGRNNIEGDPSQPCLQLLSRGFWRFRWVVQSGYRYISISAKQPENKTPYPSMIIKKNPSIGVDLDVEGVSTGGTGWVTIEAVITPSSAGAVWVELHANYDAPTETYFDNLTFS